MDELTVSENPALEEAFAAYVQAQERGHADVACKLLLEHAGLAQEVATYYALCARVPQPWENASKSYDGRTVGDFELLHELGHGGEGVVYQAKQISLQRLVAVKVMKRSRTVREDDAKRFRRDSALLASLKHANLVEIYFAGESEVGPYFAMEFVAGGTLKDKLGKGWLPTPRQAAEILRLLADAMACAHQAGIIHRDLKPANVLLKLDGTPKIVDFGLAKQLDVGNSLTIPDAIIGTASYMSPEAARGERATFALDIYGLGVILYELLTGRPPFVAASLHEMLDQVRENDPVPIRQIRPEVPLDLETICLICLSKNPEARYGSANELAADLQHFLNEEPILQRRIGLTQRAWRMILRQQFTNVADWGWIILIGGTCAAAFHLLQASLIADDASLLVVRSSHAAMLIVLITYPAIVFRGRRLEKGDRIGIASTTALIVGSAILALVHYQVKGTSLMQYRLSLYPLLGLVQAIVFFMQGPAVWGGFYVYGVMFLLLAMVMAAFPLWSPILFALFIAATQIPLGWYVLRLEQTPDVKK